MILTPKFNVKHSDIHSVQDRNGLTQVNFSIPQNQVLPPKERLFPGAPQTGLLTLKPHLKIFSRQRPPLHTPLFVPPPLMASITTQSSVLKRVKQVTSHLHEFPNKA